MRHLIDARTHPVPYSISQDIADCDGYAVVKDSDGTVMGCHDSQGDAQEQIAAIEASEADRQAKEDIDTTPTQAMQDAARRGLEMHEEGKGGDGLEGATVREAQRMADGEALTEAKVRKGNAFWGRNDNYCNDDASDAQITSRLLWGGCGSIDWFERKYQAFEEAEADRRMQRQIEIEDLRSALRKALSASVPDADEWYVSDVSIESVEGDSASGTCVVMDWEDSVAYRAAFEYDGEKATLSAREEWVEVEDVWQEVDGRLNSCPTHRSWTTGASIRMSSDGDRTTVQVMTEDLARDGMVLRADGLQTDDYMRNPVVLWDHGMDPQRGSRPIARTVDLQRVDGGLRATLEWYDDGFSQDIRDQVRRGFLSAVSIGWRTLDAAQEEIDGRSVPVVTRSDMTEFSFVGVPADAGALVLERASRGDLDSRLRAALEPILEEALAPIKERLGDLRSTRDTHGAPGATASATADTAPSDSEDGVTAPASADDVPDESRIIEAFVRFLDSEEAEQRMRSLIDKRLGRA